MTGRLLLLLTLFVLALPATGCAPKTTGVPAPEAVQAAPNFKTPLQHWPESDSPALKFLDIQDPWEPLNRTMYEVNATLDEYALYPASRIYKGVVPRPVRKGVSNVLNNLGEVPVFVNCLLQLKMKKAAITFSRFLINSTFGLAGIGDLASNNPKLQRQHEDVGQTLGTWGLDSGPYIILPLVGPSNLRDTVGFGGDTLLVYLEMGYIYSALSLQNNRPLDMTELLVRGIDKRANTAFSYHQTGSPFEYEMVRFLYTKKRKLDIQR